MSSSQPKFKIGVMGSSGTLPADSDYVCLLAKRLGQAVADRDCILVTGATTGFPDLVSRAARQRGGWTIGISPASCREEHLAHYGLPDDGADAIVYTGFGLKGRNVINVRTCDVVIIFGGGFGTLNEFTIAYDEGKVVGVLEGTGGVADRIKEVSGLGTKKVNSALLFDSSPEALVAACLKLAGTRNAASLENR
jgi:uncharacterized protein (TIGR00725 family)